MKVAIENGCNLVTHLYSCTSTITRDHGFRILGVIETAYLCDDMWVELICDGKHLPPELIKMIIKIKGTDKVILTTDSSYVAGSDIKEGNLTGTPFIVEDGVCKLLDRSAFAASCATANVLIRTLTKGCGYSIPTAVKMLTYNPAKLCSLNKGVLEKGYDADVIVFDNDINVKKVFVGGKAI
jgi:N-acetylglucosamine-6-phosphate deacetylase